MRNTRHCLPVLNHRSPSPARWRTVLAAKIAFLTLFCLLVIPIALTGLANNFGSRINPGSQAPFMGRFWAVGGFITGGNINTHTRNLAPDGLTAGLTIDLEDYWQRVEDTRDQAVWAKDQPADEIRTAFLHAAALWEDLDAVRLPDGTNTPIDTSVIVAELRADPPDPERLETLLTTLLDQRQNWPNGPFGTADIASLNEILAKPEYQWEEEAPPSPLQEWFARQFQRFINWLFGALEGRLGSAGLRIWQIIIIALGALALIFVLTYAGRHLRRAVTAEAELGGDERIEENLSAGAALSKAQAMSASGDYRMAVRYLYLAALLQLEERGLLRYDRSRTNREYLRDIKKRSAPQSLERWSETSLSDSFTEVVEVFDRVWYGYQPLDQAGYENYTAQVERLREQR